MSYSISLLISLLLFGCSIGTNNPKSNLDRKSTEEQAYQALTDLEKSLVQTNLTINKLIADSLYKEALEFVALYPKSKQKEQALVLAAKCSDGLDLSTENIQLIDQLLLTFPDSENAPNYLYNKGKIYEEKLNDVSTAKTIYQDLIKRYPKSELAKNMLLYLDFLNQSEEEQFNFLKQK